MSNVEIKGIIPPILTPMNADESLNLPELRNQIERLLSGGVHGLFAFGTNGEGYILSENEKYEVLEVMIDQVKGRVPVYAGTGCISTRDTIRQSLQAEKMGADVLSIITPSFAAASQKELYLSIAADAIIPAFAYYFGVFVLVSALAKKRASRSKQSEDAAIEVKKPLLPRMYLLLPVVVLIVSIMNGFSLMRSGMYGIFVCLACNVASFFIEKGPKNAWSNIVNGIQDGDFAGLKQLWKSMMAGAKSAAEIAIPTAACGIIIDVMTEQTSLATNLSGVIAGLGMSNLFVALLIAMIGCMLLGMALPTVAAYLVGVTLFVPTLRSLGIQPLVANMFVFYYGIMAQITPPVCVASYTAAGIAGADAMKTGLRGMLFALVGFLCPFVFVYNPAILLQGTVIEIIIGAAQLLVGTYFLALAVSGYFKRELPLWMRLVFFVVALCFIDPNWVTTLIGLAVGVALVVWNIMAAKKTQTA